MKKGSAEMKNIVTETKKEDAETKRASAEIIGAITEMKKG